MPEVNVDFYLPVNSAGAFVDLGPSLLAAAKKPAPERLKRRNSLYSDFFESASELGNGQVAGTAARIRMKGLPGHFDYSSFSLNSLNIMEKDGVSEEVHFLVDGPLQTIALQRNGHFRSTQVEMILKDVTGLDFSLDPKIRGDVAKRLEKLEHVGSLEFRLKDPAFHPDFATSLPAVSALISEVNKSADLASIDIKMKLRRGIANPQEVSRFKNLLNSLAGQANATKLIAKGRNAKEKTDTIDFMRDRIVATGTVDYSEGRRLDGAQCQLLLRQELDKNRIFLQTLLLPGE